MKRAFQFSGNLIKEITVCEGIDCLGFADEPDFQLSILRDQVPLVVNDKPYYPLLAEFPKSPGIDLIYVAADFDLLLVEMKHKNYNSQDAQSQIIFHSQRYGNSRLQDLIQYGENHPYESDSTLLDKFKQVNLPLKTTIAELIALNRCLLGCLFYGDIKHNEDDVYTYLFGIKYNDTLLYEHCFKPNVSTEKFSELTSVYERKLESKRNIERGKWSTDEVLRITSSSPNNKIRIIHELTVKKGYQVRGGSGKSWSCSVLFKLKGDKSCAIINLNDVGMLIPGNLYYQLDYLNLARSEIDKLMKSILGCLDENSYTVTEGKAIRIAIGSEKTTPKQIERVCKIISLFTDLCISA